MSIDATYMLGKKSGSGRHDMFEVSTVDDDGACTVCGVFYVRHPTSDYVTAALEALTKFLESNKIPFNPACVFIDECHAGACLSAVLVSLSLCYL